MAENLSMQKYREKSCTTIFTPITPCKMLSILGRNSYTFYQKDRVGGVSTSLTKKPSSDMSKFCLKHIVSIRWQSQFYWQKIEPIRARKFKTSGYLFFALRGRDFLLSREPFYPPPSSKTSCGWPFSLVSFCFIGIKFQRFNKTKRERDRIHS